MTTASTVTGVFTDAERQAILDEYGPLVTRKTAAKIIGSSERTVGRQVDAGRLKLYKVGCARSLRVKTTDVLALQQRVA
jgi:hypothetical protein